MGGDTLHRRATEEGLWGAILLKCSDTKSLKCVMAPQPHNEILLGNQRTSCSIMQVAENSPWPEVVIKYTSFLVLRCQHISKVLFPFYKQSKQLSIHNIQGAPSPMRFILFHLIQTGRNCFFGAEEEYQEYLHLNNI